MQLTKSIMASSRKFSSFAIAAAAAAVVVVVVASAEAAPGVGVVALLFGVVEL